MVFLSVFKFSSHIPKRAGSFIDSLRITVKGGPGGMGHPKYGGMGGKGGNVVLVASEDITTLQKVLKKFPTKVVKASEGENSHVHRLVGQAGTDFILPVPSGISVFTETGTKLGELNKESDKLVVAKGGLGGQPATQFNGLKGEEIKIVLDLKLIADVGLVGFPNAGKSSLLRAISRAKPQVAEYPFTTLRPQLGVIQYDDLRSITMADLPGLIEGAHRNLGLGYRFLKHIERTKLLVFLIDINGFQLSPNHPHRKPLEILSLLNRELELYGKDILSKPALLIVNKMDTPGAQNMWQELKPLLDNYESSIRLLPQQMQPKEPIAFDEVWNMSVQQDSQLVHRLAVKIRNLLDTYNNLEILQSPLQLAAENLRDSKKNDRMQLALAERHSSKLM